MAQQLAGAQANIPVQVPVQVPAQTQQQVPMIPKSSNNQAMQNYSNLLQQGVQNYASQMGNPNFGVNQPAQQKQQKNISTQGYPTPRFL
ncbi:MAG: hypothetical protein EBR82_56360 [Caulobacteraceae bacterium]|nr:hypothetical protein [Caulobacteraceae bacterium]